MAISLRPRSHAPVVPRSATGTAARWNSSRSGPAPSRCRAWVIAEVDGTFQSWSQEPRLCSVPVICRMTSSYACPKNSPRPITYRTIT